jgi:hypothetical protein
MRRFSFDHVFEHLRAAFYQTLVAVSQDLTSTLRMLTYTVAHEWAGDSSRTVMEGLKNFNAAFIGTDHPKQLAIIVRDEEQRIVAGLLGETRWDWMYIGWVWVSDRN